MPAETYELISQGLRYWFVLLGISIVIRSYRWALTEHRRQKAALKALPDAGLIGEIVNLATGDSQPLPREGIVGSGRSCDIHYSGIRKFELEFEFIDGRGVSIVPSHRHHQIMLHNNTLGKAGYALHGSRLHLPGYSLRFRLFAGLNVPEQEYTDDLQHHDFLKQGEFDMESLGDTGMPEEYFDNLVTVADEPDGKENPLLQLENHNIDVKTAADEELFWDPQLTWQYAPIPEEELHSVSIESFHSNSQPIWEKDSGETRYPVLAVRKRRSKRHEK